MLPLAKPVSALATIGDRDLSTGLAAARSHRLDLLNHVISRGHLPKDHVLAVKMRSLTSAHKELAAVGVRSSVGHGQAACAGVLACFARKAFVFKLGTIDRLATGAVVVGEIATLAHEAWDHPVEARALVTKALLSCAQSTEVVCCFWHCVCIQFEFHSACRRTTDGHLEEDFRVGHG